MRDFRIATGFQRNGQIFQVNSIQMDGKGELNEIFWSACRINHSCDANWQSHLDERIGRNTIHAVRDIGKGREITRYYLHNNDGFWKYRQE